MRFVLEQVNGGLSLLQRERSKELSEIEEVLGGIEYQVQYCGQQGRETEMIFSPSFTNHAINAALSARGWEVGVRLANPSYDSGKDVDFYKNGIVLEAQFAHYGLLTTDISRMERLYTGNLRLQPRGDGSARGLIAGIALVVDRSMPTSQSVAHMDQLRTRGAPIAQTLPLVLVGVLPPQSGDMVVRHDLTARSRTSSGSTRVRWP